MLSIEPLKLLENDRSALGTPTEKVLEAAREFDKFLRED
jgi:hypothetical protein